MASAVIGSLRVVLGIDTALFDQGLGNAMKSLKGVGKSMQSVGKSMSTFLTAPLVGFGALTVKTAGDFEAAMNRVGAATDATGGELKSLQKLALDLGANTSKSASESADMLEMLAKNGLSAGQILDGAAASAIKLSEATGGDLSRSADVATNVMAQFGLKANDLATVVDQITSVTLASQFGFDDYALALGQAGGAAGALGVNLTDFNAVLATTSSVFNSGSDAGTSFKTFLTRLVPASSSAAAAMENLGLKFFEADGSMKSMSAIAEELRTKMGGLSDENMNQAMTDIFGVDGMRTAIMLMKEGGAGVDAMIEKINQKGVADQQAAARMQGFNGELEKLGGAFENLQIAIASSGLLTMVTDLVTSIAGWVDALAQTSPELLNWGVIVAGLAVALGPLVLALGVVASGIAAIGLPVAAAIAAITAITAVVVAFWPEIKQLGSAIVELVSGPLAQMQTAWDGMTTKLGAVRDAFINLKDQAIAAVSAMYAQIKSWVGDKLNAVWDGVASKIDWVSSKFYGLYDAVVGHSFIPDMVIGIGEWMAKLGGLMVEPAAAAANQTSSAFQGAAMSAATAGTQMGDAWAGLRNVTAEATTAGKSFEGVFSGLGSSIAGLIKGTKDWRDVLADVAQQLMQMAFSGMGGMGGFGGFISSLVSGLVGFARGGTILPGGAGGIDSQVVAFRKSPNEQVDITKPGQRGGSGSMHVTFGLASDGALNIMPEVRNVSREEASSAAGKVAKAVPSMVDSRNNESRLRRIRPAGAF